MDVDYLIIGAGATGLCFADQLLASSDATMAIVDKRGTPGGHWVDSYPFVELHQPASFYGVNSTPLGSGRIDTAGPNKGLGNLASGSEVLAHFQCCVRERLLPSGRVHYFPLHQVEADETVRSLISGNTVPLNAKKRVVDASAYENVIPKTHTRQFSVEGDIDCVPINDLPMAAPGREHFLVIGGGKTGVDAILHLLKAGADPDAISWVVPRDSWFMNRQMAQPDRAFFSETVGGLANQVEAMAAATSSDDLALRMEAAGQWLRVDPNIVPRMYHAATITEAELEMLRSLGNIIRKGRVRKLEPGRLELDEGTVAIPANTLAVDCTASAISKRPPQKVFDGRRITCQLLRFPAVSFSAAFLAFLECHFDTDDEKNRFATPVALPDTPHDFVLTSFLGMMNQGQWRQDEAVSALINE